MIGLDDFKSINMPEADFSELLLFDGDIERCTQACIEEVLSKTNPSIRYVHVQEFVTHGPDRFMVDLSSEDDIVRKASVDVVRGTRALAAALGRLPVVVHPGGIRKEQVDRAKLLRNLARSLSELGPSKLLLENMPWHYWYDRKERMVSNVCSSIDDMIRFKDMVDGFTLDLCHGYLSKPEGDPEYCRQFMKTFGAFTKHIHASDAKAPDSEGLQIGDGEVDFSVLKGKVPPVLVEVWNGHADGGQGFRMGIQRLREMENAW
jgi:sugar phosphate isomerase/epimerase